MRRCDVGGQAVMEGVMMRGSKGVAIAVRKEDGEIVIKNDPKQPFLKRHPKLNIPFLRGIFALAESLKVGTGALNFSASLFAEDDEEPSGFEKWLNRKFGGKANDVIIGITMVISMLLSIVIFVGIPTVVTSLFKKLNLDPVALNVIEAVFRIAILIIYMWGIGKMEDIQRVFQYHGAEHKTIFCYESEEELTVENVKKFTRLHPRCGTNFIFLVMFISVFVFSFTGWGGIAERMALRIVMIPVISGITYEIIKWLGRNEGSLSKMIASPGLKLQLLTTREPDESQIEVAIASLKASEGIE